MLDQRKKSFLPTTKPANSPQMKGINNHLLINSWLNRLPQMQVI